MSTAESQSAAPTPKLRWFQYSLRSLLLITLLASIGMSGWLVVKRQRERQRTIHALKQPTRIDFIKTPLRDVGDYLQHYHRIEIRIDRDALQAAGINEDLPVTRNLKGLSLQSALRLLLRDLDLTYTIRGKVLWITTPQQAAATGTGPPTVDIDDANERRIVTALKDPTRIECVEEPLRDVVVYLHDYHAINIQLDNKALRQAGIEYDTPVTFNLKNVSLQSALRLLLRDLDLDYVIRDEVLFITTSREAAAMMPPQPDFRTPAMVANEKRIADALASQIQIKFSRIPLQDAVDRLKDRHKIEIQIDRSGLKRAGIDTNPDVTSNLQWNSLRSALPAMLDGLGLEFEIRDEVLLITPKNKDKR